MQWSKSDSVALEYEGGELGEAQKVTVFADLERLLSSQRYFPVSLLGSGGSGKVILARDKTLGDRLVAIKMLHSTVFGPLLLQFQQEAKLTASLDHRSIVSIFDFGVSEGGAPYMVLEYVPGKSLAQIVEETGALPQEDALNIAIQIADALDYANSRKVFHRDLKDANVLLQFDEKECYTAKIIDFGIGFGQDLQRLTQFQGKTLVGTPEFMPPDQAKGQEFDERSEIYTFGCLLFKLLTGSLPFTGSSPLEVIARHTNEIPPRLCDVKSDSAFPQRLESLVAGCLAKDKSERVQSFSHVKAELESIASESHCDAVELTRQSGSPSGNVTGRYSIGGVLVAAILTLTVVGGTVCAYILAECKPSAPLQTKRTSGTKLDKSVLSNLDADRYARIRELMKAHALVFPKIFYDNDDLLPLEQYKDAQVVDISNSIVTDDGLKSLLNSKVLKLDAHKSGVMRLDNISCMSSLQTLRLGENNIGDGELPKLAKLPTLSHLDIRATDVTEQGLKWLTGIPTLRDVTISHDYSETAVQRLREKLPDCIFRPYYRDSIVSRIESSIAGQEPSEGGRIYKKCIQIIEAAQGKNAPGVSIYFRKWSDLCWRNGARDEGSRLAQKAIEISELNGDMVSLQKSLEQEAKWLASSGQKEKSYPLMVRAAEIMLDVVKRDSTSLLSSLLEVSAVAQSAKDYEVALKFNNTGIELAKRYNPQSPALPIFLTQSCALYRMKGDKKLALAYGRESLEYYRHNGSTDKDWYTVALVEYGLCLEDLGKRKVVLREAISVVPRPPVSEPYWFSYCDACYFLSDIYKNENNLSEAEKHLRLALKMVSKIRANVSDRKKQYAKNEAFLLRKLGREEEARRFENDYLKDDLSAHGEG
ncbi:MAG: protein kinase [Cyanobacteria bacterium]|nr:protein kinase [Cyanobacteriota bacterium]